MMTVETSPGGSINLRDCDIDTTQHLGINYFDGTGSRNIGTPWKMLYALQKIFYFIFPLHRVS